jgi:twitching motility protein PilI
MMTPTEALQGAFTQVMPAQLSKAAATSQALASANAREHARQGLAIGNLRLMVGYEDGSELTEMPQLFQLPNTPDWFCGIANLHGVLTPVFDLCKYIGVAPDAQARRMLLVLSHGADAAGILIDGLPRRLRWREDARADAGAAPARLAPHVRGAALIDGQLWFDLECAALLDALEQAMAGLQ